MQDAMGRLIPFVSLLLAACEASFPAPRVPPPATVVQPGPTQIEHAPTIDVEGGAVRFNGVIVDRAPREDIVELEGLHERLRELRATRPADERIVRFLATDNLTMATVFSVQHTAAFSGFWRMTWMLGSLEVEILTRVPGVEFHEHEEHRAFVSLELGNEEFAELFARMADDGEPAPPGFAVRAPKVASEDAKLVQLVEDACRKKPCGGLLVEAPGFISFGRVRPMILAASSASGGPLLLSFVKPDGAKETWTRIRGDKQRPAGRLAAEVIQGVVRASYDEFRACYRRGLVRDPQLRGNVSVRFLIAENGSVETASPAGGDLADEGVVRCILDVYTRLRFPAPDGGVVSVVYPIAFDP